MAAGDTDGGRLEPDTARLETDTARLETDEAVEAVDAAPALGVRNSQAEGVGRVVALDGLVAWNNLGRNVVFAGPDLRPRAVWGSTRYPDDDEASQYDLDVHAVVDLPGGGAVAVLNHLGHLRLFERARLAADGPVRPVEPTSTLTFAADVERMVVAGPWLVGSRPRSEGAVGLVTARWAGATGELDVEIVAVGLGEVTALGAPLHPGDPSLAVGGPGQVALVDTADGRFARTRWQAGVGFRVATLVSHGGRLWAAGPPGGDGVDDHDWESLGGGGYAALDPATGEVLATGRLPADTAWGTGGVPVTPAGAGLAVVGRTGCVHLVDPWRPGADAAVTSPVAPASLGMAHAATAGQTVLFGFNRGGYRLYAHRIN